MAGYTHGEPFDSGLLAAGPIHQVHYEQYGQPDGLPVVFLHGGPGGQALRSDTKFFNPEVYRVVLADQRGAGKSLPRGELADNTTHDLVADIDRLRAHIGVDRWHMVFGGSWGSTLGLLYAQTFPERVGSLVVRGVLAAREAELAFARGPAGAAQLFPDRYERFVGFLPPAEREQPYAAYHARLMSDDREAAMAAAVEWNRWAISVSSIRTAEDAYQDLDDREQNLVEARIESHYFANRAWLAEGQLLDKANVDRMAHISGAIVQGRYDLLTPPRTAWDLHKLWPKAELHWIDAAGHSASEPETTEKLVEVCDRLSKLGHEASG